MWKLFTMKNYFWSILIALIFGACSNDNQPINLKVILEGYESGESEYLFVREFVEQKVIDSLPISDQQSEYNFTIETDEESIYYLSINTRGIKNSLFIASHGSVTETVHFPTEEGSELTVDVETNNKQFKDYQIYENQTAEYDQKIESLGEEYNQLRSEGKLNTDEELEAFNLRYTTVQTNRDNVSWDFVNNHKNLAGLLVLSTDLRYSTDLDKLSTAISDFKEPYTNHSLYKNVLDKRDRLSQVQIGQVAPNFSAPNSNGEQVSVEDFRGKYLLIDFWASWCGPCRKENPNLVKLYNEYHDKGFEILGVSYDFPGQEASWLKAIEKDGLLWPQVSNLQGWEDPTVSLYVVTGIPSPFLLDPEGIIIAKEQDAAGSNLRQKLVDAGL